VFEEKKVEGQQEVERATSACFFILLRQIIKDMSQNSFSCYQG
jgi:hypothetical protein